LHSSVGEGTYLNAFHTMFISCSRKKKRQSMVLFAFNRLLLPW